VYPCKAIQDFRAGIIETSSFLYPMQMGFTTHSTLYSLEYQLTVRIYLSGAKDLISTQPIHICSWSAERCAELMESIERATGMVDRKQSCSRDSFIQWDSEKRIVVD
jgi:hypothetical protein